MKLLKIPLLILIIVLFSIAIRAGEAIIHWQPPAQGPTPTGYLVYTGLTDPPQGSLDVGLVLQLELLSVPDCSRSYYAVRAYNASESSALSEVVSTFPRPIITDVTSDGTGTHTIIGSNFDVNIKVYVDAGSGFVELPSGDVERVSCNEVTIPSVPIYRVQVGNQVQPPGHGEPLDIFSQPWPAPIGVMVE